MLNIIEHYDFGEYNKIYKTWFYFLNIIINYFYKHFYILLLIYFNEFISKNPFLIQNSIYTLYIIFYGISLP